MTFTNAQMGEVLAWQEGNNASNEEAAVYFLSTYPEVWGDLVERRGENQPCGTFEVNTEQQQPPTMQ